MTPDLTELTHAQFCAWLESIVNSAFFASRARLTALLAENATKDVLEDEFREFFEGIGVKFTKINRCGKTSDNKYNKQLTYL